MTREKEVCLMAIKALEQNGDAVNLDTVIDWLKDNDFIKMNYQEENAKRELRELISVNSQELYDFANWVASEIFDEMWEYNKDAFAEIACRKLAKLGIVRAKGDEWELVDPQESEDKR